MRCRRRRTSPRRPRTSCSPSGPSSRRPASATRTRRPSPSTAATACRARGTSARGVPYATHHMGLVPVAGGDREIVAVVPRAQFRMLDNWGDLIGLKGSGSHSVVVEGAIVPSPPHDRPRRVAVDRREHDAWIRAARQPALRRLVHGRRPRRAELRAGRQRPGRRRRVRAPHDQADPSRGGQPGQRAVARPNYQRVLGLALSHTDAAQSVVIRCGELFHEYAREAMEGGRPFDAERTFRIYGQLMTAHKLCWEAADMVFRAGSSSGARDGARLQRLWRDLCASAPTGSTSTTSRRRRSPRPTSGSPSTSSTSRSRAGERAPARGARRADRAGPSPRRRRPRRRHGRRLVAAATRR